MNINDFPGHNHYHFLPGGAGGKWCWLGYDFDSGFTYGRVGALRAFYGDGNNGDSPDWQRNKLCARVSANATLRRVYLLTLRHMLNEVILEDVMYARLDELFALMTPDRQANAVWGTLRTSTAEAKSVLSSQKQSLLNYLAAANLPGADKTPQISLAGGRVPAGTALTLTGPQGWTIYFTLDGSDPRLSPNRGAYSVPLVLSTSGTFKVAAIPANESLTTGDWSDLASASFVIVPRPRLSILPNGSRLTLSWSATFTNQAVESAATLEDSWTNVVVTPTLVGDHFEADPPAAGFMRFYRLRGQ